MFRLMRFLLLLVLLLLPRLALAASSTVYSSPRDEVRLISASNDAQNGTVKLALDFTLKPGWHIYWRDPGDAGFPPSVSAEAPVTLGPIAFPAPEFFSQAGVGAYVLSGHVVLPFTSSHVSGNQVSVQARWLVCSNQCVPEQAHFTLNLTGGPAAEAGLFPATPSIVPSPYAAHLAADGTLSLTGVTATQVKAARFFPDSATVLVNDAPQPLSFSAQGVQLHLKLAGKPPAALSGVLELTDPSGQTQALRLTTTPAPPAAHAPWWLLALAGGLILNLMPCVFPVLAMKAVAFARMGGAAHGHIRREALGYTAGVLVSMAALGGMLLGLRAAGISAFWGFQFQSPVFVALAAWVILAAGLSLAGLFHLSMPGFIGRVPAQHSFLTGLLAVLVATPCTAPFMGAAIAAALALPPLPAMGLFLALGLGLALPILMIAAVPHLAAALPRPGRWMMLVQKLLAVPMFATFVWLGWVLFQQAGAPALALLALGALTLGLALPRRPVFVLLVLVLLPFFHAVPARPALTLPGAQPYSASELAALRAQGRPVFIDLTAAWCITCQVNERSTLATAPVQRLFKDKNVAVLVGDWTDRSPAITALLAANHRAGVPLYLYYPPGQESAKVLPQILTPGIVATAISR
ncbi:thiol:disulfide interchange protein DsbD [Acidocella aminolytica 101 = DSM 11237]|uniref:Cytochrome c biogenesis thiol:disulfide interchange protein DsbD n=2 Tax=Acidocella TaxID=50709 RepID=A0A0D6PIN0_9PROT|nr:cytochrome c biogenesis thiol:disulfide interchange protein DsbD [Acidocella aminolytica 101 = DSM 11237]GBQ37008.1 thiol:disulfide interchange protein [Acidocella aminolytica 101 = DSM 11237]SHE84820.1 thiol:disulfide interchange protein DsbD [Acidocella aminolytica 101 = DSM 11237]